MSGTCSRIILAISFPCEARASVGVRAGHLWRSRPLSWIVVAGSDSFVVHPNVAAPCGLSFGPLHRNVSTAALSGSCLTDLFTATSDRLFIPFHGTFTS